MNKNLITYSIIFFLVISFFGFNFLIGLLGNILILIVLTPLLLIGLAFLGINSFKTKLKVCTNCGATTLSNSQSCLYCGSNLSESENIKNLNEDASNETIEIEAEEIK